MTNSVPSREFQLIESLRAACGDSSHRWIVGIGDDCAVRKPSAQPLTLSTDTMVEQVHFRLDLMSLAEVGFKAIASSVSDLFAMGGTAESCAINLVFPKSAGESAISELYRGIGEAVALFETPVIGGDLSSGPCWIIAVTVLGDCDRPLLRRHAKPGDSIWVTGTPGLSGLGLDLLLAYGRSKAASIDPEAVAAHVRPLPRRTVAPILGTDPAVHAMIDISDGVGKEVRTIATESGVGARLTLPDSLLHRLNQPAISRSPLELILTGGEDYELLFTAAPDFTPPAGHQFTRIGTITESPERVVVLPDGSEQPIAGGWDHW